MRDRRDPSKPSTCAVEGFDHEGQPLKWIGQGTIARVWAVLGAAEWLETGGEDVPADSFELLLIVRQMMRRAEQHRAQRAQLEAEQIPK